MRGPRAKREQRGDPGPGQGNPGSLPRGEKSLGGAVGGRTEPVHGTDNRGRRAHKPVRAPAPPAGPRSRGESRLSRTASGAGLAPPDSPGLLGRRAALPARPPLLPASDAAQRGAFRRFWPHRVRTHRPQELRRFARGSAPPARPLAPGPEHADALRGAGLGRPAREAARRVAGTAFPEEQRAPAPGGLVCRAARKCGSSRACDRHWLAEPWVLRGASVEGQAPSLAPHARVLDPDGPSHV